jgi:hypothetical protein
MAAPYTVALVVDASFGDRLLPLAQRMHTWVVDAPANKEAAKRYWAKLPEPRAQGIEQGITTFVIHDPDGKPEEWCAGIIGSLDIHHNEYSHSPGYAVLEVYGAQPTDEVKVAFREYGLLNFQPTDFGFVARKYEP